MLAMTGTATSSVVEPSLASSPARVISPKLNWIIGTAGNQ